MTLVIYVLKTSSKITCSKIIISIILIIIPLAADRFLVLDNGKLVGYSFLPEKENQ